MAGNTVGVPNSANYFDGDHVGFPGAALTNGGAYGLNSDSAYGTNDQAGNVFEWNDAVLSGSSRGMRGGSWNNASDNLLASLRIGFSPTTEGSFAGFRVAAVPEPTSLVLTILAGSFMLSRQKR